MMTLMCVVVGSTAAAHSDKGNAGWLGPLSQRDG